MGFRTAALDVPRNGEIVQQAWSQHPPARMSFPTRLAVDRDSLGDSHRAACLLNAAEEELVSPGRKAADPGEQPA